MASSSTSYDNTIVIAKSTLGALHAILKKGETAPNAADLPSARIFEDMLPLTVQVHIACAHANRLVARTTGSDHPGYENDLSSFDDMYARIAHAQNLLDGADKDTVNKRANDIINFETGPDKSVEISIMTYANVYSLPNTFFHVTTAYNILRNQGVPLGKMDYLGAFYAGQVPGYI